MEFLWIVLRTLAWAMFCSKAEMFAKTLAMRFELTTFTLAT